MDWKEVILPLLLAAIAAAPGVLALFRGRSKEKAEASRVITDAAKDLLAEYRVKMDEIEESYRAKLAEVEEECKMRIAATEAMYQSKMDAVEAKVKEQSKVIDCQERKIAKQQIEIDRLKEEQDDFLEGVIALCAQIRRLGHDPVWEPEK